MSGAAHEVVTRPKLSRQSRDAASMISKALQKLLSDGENLRPVKRLLDEADSILSRSPAELADARGLVDGALARSGGGKKKASSKKRAASAMPADGRGSGDGASASEPTKTASKKAASKKRSAKRSATA